MGYLSLVMKTNELIAALENRKENTFAWISYSGIPSGLTASAKREGRIIKESLIPISLSDYSARKAVAAAIASGEREAPKLPDYLEFVEPVAGGAYIARHKGNGTLYFRAPKNNVHVKPSKYFLDGAEVDFESIREFFTASALAPKKTKAELNELGQDEFRGVKLENIKAVS
jgi:hypothetical protein